MKPRLPSSAIRRSSRVWQIAVITGKTCSTLYTDVINEVIARAPKDMALGLHLCRGNKGGHWQAEGVDTTISRRICSASLLCSFTFWNTTPPGREALRRLLRCRRTKPWCWVLSRPKSKSWKRWTTSNVASLKRRNMSRWIACVSHHNAAFPAVLRGPGWMKMTSRPRHSCYVRGLAQDLWGYEPPLQR